jgi:hypothetical protein
MRYAIALAALLLASPARAASAMAGGIRMATIEEAKEVLREINIELARDDLTAEERQTLKMHAYRVSGAMLSGPLSSRAELESIFCELVRHRRHRFRRLLHALGAR